MIYGRNYFAEISSMESTLRQKPRGVHYLKVYFFVSFPQAKRVGNPSGKDSGQAGMTEIWNCGIDHTM
jgi:hypothetical protein